MTNDPAIRQMSVADAITLASKDIPTFGQIWFPKTFRQASPPFHYNMSHVLETPGNRLVGLEVFRDGAKTTFCRTYLAKRIAYCLTRTAMIVNISAPKAQHSTRWVMRQIEFNKPFAQAYGLKKYTGSGAKWNPEWFTCINAQEELVNVVAAGITSGLRGLNIDDFRPDFILCDDINDRENTATEEQRLKADEAFFAQLVRSLAPPSEAPLAQLALAQTPINIFDIISKAEKDPQFKVFKYSCFDPSGESAWPARRSTESLLKEKQGYINRNQLAIWLAEMEVTLVSSESQAFKLQWLKYYDVTPELAEGRVVIAADPASSDEKDADFFAIAVLFFWREKVYLLEYNLQRGMMPDAACAKIFEFALRYNARDVVIETVAYQRILKWYLEQEIQKRRIWLNVHSYDDRRRKDDRMVQAMTQVAPYGNLLIQESMQEFIEVFQLYGPGFKGKVDLLDCVSIGISWHFSGGQQFSDIEGEFRRLREAEESLEDTDYHGAP